MQGYYRFPTIHENIIIFTAEGDLWRVSSKGGVAQRLTTHQGIEKHAKISPDGRLVAFSAQYEGPTEVYVMSMHGGRPLRLTYEDEVALVVGWTLDGRVLYSTAHYSTLPSTQLCTIHPETMVREIIPLAEASDGAFDKDGRTLFFTRYPFQGSYTKRYQGGTVQNIWKFKPGQEAVPLTLDFPGTSKTPMIWNHRVYFVSDRDGTMNIWSMTRNGKRLKQHTHHKGWDVQSPSLQGGRIVYQSGADIHLYHIETGSGNKVDITLLSDFDQTGQRWVKNPIDYITSWCPSPKGDKVVLTARGQLFVAPVENGRFVHATHQHDGRFRAAQFTSDGKTLLAYSDQSGEMELFSVPADGIGEIQQITDTGDIFRYTGSVSPDGQWFASVDKNHKLWLTHIENKETQLVLQSEIDTPFHLKWSPDSQWLCFVERAENTNFQLKLYHLAQKEITAVTSDRVSSYSPAWSPDGKWLYFLSDRNFETIVQSPWGPRQPDPYMEATTKIYKLSLQPGNTSPFWPKNELDEQNDETTNNETKNGSKNNSQKDENDSPKTKKKPEPVQIDFENLNQRLYELPILPGNYFGLSINKKALFWIEMSNDVQPKFALMGLPISHKDHKPNRLYRDIQGYNLTQSGNKLLVRQKKTFFMLEATGKLPKAEEKKQLNLAKWTFAVNLQQEWRQMFTEAWRLERDYFYDPNLHQVDWQHLLDQHLPLLDRITDRDEFNHLLAQMVGELAALHTFVHSGDIRRGQDRVYSGSLGVQWGASNEQGVSIAHIYQTDPDYPKERGPLLQPEINIEVGDVVEMINGVPTASVSYPAILLQNKVDQDVRVKVRSQSEQQSFERVVKPISIAKERDLRYGEWEYSRRLMVEEKSQNQIGYIHLRAMGRANYKEWTRHYYPVFNRQGLVIDVRHNRGGNIDSWILGKLMRQAWFFWQPRVGKPSWNMQYAFRGHMVVLVNGRTSSDGEVLADGFRRLGLGKVIGTRTWGGEIWLSRNTWLADKGIATAAQTGVYLNDEWLIEGHGLDPDIIVDNLPHATFKGQDAQLDAAIAHLLQLIADDPRPIPSHPPYPDKSFSYGSE